MVSIKRIFGVNFNIRKDIRNVHGIDNGVDIQGYVLEGYSVFIHTVRAIVTDGIFVLGVGTLRGVTDM